MSTDVIVDQETQRDRRIRPQMPPLSSFRSPKTEFIIPEIGASTKLLLQERGNRHLVAEVEKVVDAQIKWLWAVHDEAVEHATEASA